MKLNGCDFFEHHDQGATIRLEPFDFNQVTDTTAFLLAALDEFSPIFRPLTAELLINCVHPQWRFSEYSMQVEQPAWFMYTPWLSRSLLTILHASPVYEEIDVITIDALSEWIQRACRQKCVSNQDYVVNWDSLFISTTCAQVFDVEQFIGRNSLRMQRTERPRNIIDVPIEQDGNQLWVWGADQTMQKNLISAPFRVILFNQTVTFHLEVHWSLWTEPTSLGFQVICEIVQQLLGKGWKVSFASEPFRKSLQPN